jgi:hypothetical protein
MKLGRHNYICGAMLAPNFVIARNTVTKQSRVSVRNTGLLRFARNDGVGM